MERLGVQLQRERIEWLIGNAWGLSVVRGSVGGNGSEMAQDYINKRDARNLRR